MLPRFVVVPAVPKEVGAIRIGVRFYCQTVPAGFNIYDNREKKRLQVTYPNRAEVERECLKLNT
jgi:hypothetical protein